MMAKNRERRQYVERFAFHSKLIITAS